MKNKLIVLIIIWIIGFVVTALLSRLGSSFPELAYWVILGLMTLTVRFLRIRSHIVLLSAFILFLLAGFITTFGVIKYAEMIMRLSLLGWLIGFIQSVFEYSKKAP